jgi:hypothetical protein
MSARGDRNARNDELRPPQAFEQFIIALSLQCLFHLSLQLAPTGVKPADFANRQAVAEMQTVGEEQRVQALANSLVLMKLNGDFSSRKGREYGRALQNPGDLNDRHFRRGLYTGECDGADLTHRALKNETGPVREILDRCRHSSTSCEDDMKRYGFPWAFSRIYVLGFWRLYDTFSTLDFR